MANIQPCLCSGKDGFSLPSYGKPFYGEGFQYLRAKVQQPVKTLIESGKIVTLSTVKSKPCTSEPLHREEKVILL